MEFQELMNLLFAAQSKAPHMRWRVEENPANSGFDPTLEIRLTITKENAELLRQAEAMFAPTEGGS